MLKGRNTGIDICSYSLFRIQMTEIRFVLSQKLFIVLTSSEKISDNEVQHIL